MKIIFLLTFCFLLNGYIFAQIEPKKNNFDVGVEEIFLAKGDGKGNEGDVAESFTPNDVPIYCIVQLDSLKSATVKMNLVAVKVGGVKPETRVISVSYKTNGEQSRVSFKGAPQGKWVAGNYRFDIFIDGKAAGNKSFEILATNAAQKKKAEAETAKAGKKFRQR